MLPELQAGRQLQAIEAASVPYMKAATQQQVMARYANAGEKPKPQRATVLDLAQMGISVEHEHVGGETP